MNLCFGVTTEDLSCFNILIFTILQINGRSKSFPVKGKEKRNKGIGNIFPLSLPCDLPWLRITFLNQYFNYMVIRILEFLKVVLFQEECVN